MSTSIFSASSRYASPSGRARMKSFAWMTLTLVGIASLAPFYTLKGHRFLADLGPTRAILQQAADAALERVAPRDRFHVVPVDQREVAQLVERLGHAPGVLLAAHPHRRIDAPQVERQRVF